MESANPPRTVKQNLLVLIPIALFQSALYTTLNQIQFFPPRRLPLTAVDAWFPFLPWTVVPYMAFFLGSVPVALLIRTDRVFHRAIRAYFLCLLMTVPILVLWPTACPRPEISETADSWDAKAHRLLTEIDTEACSFPSLHIILPTIICWAVCAEGRRWGLWYSLAMLVLSFTILTTKQHYAWDWLGGMSIAVIGIWAAGFWDKSEESKRDSFN